MSACKYSSVNNSKILVEKICDTVKPAINGTSAKNDTQSSFAIESNEEKMEKGRITIKSWAKKPNQMKNMNAMQDSTMLKTPKMRLSKNLQNSSTTISQVSISSSYLKTLMKAPNAFTIPLSALQMITKSRGDLCKANQACKGEFPLQLQKESAMKLGSSEYVHKLNMPAITLDHDEYLEGEHPVSSRSQVVSDGEDVVDSQLSLSNGRAVIADELLQSSSIPSPLSPDLIDESSVEYLDSFDPVTIKQPCLDSISHKNYNAVDYELPLKQGNKRKRSLSTSYSFQQSKLQFSNVKKVSIKKPPRDPLDVNHSSSLSIDSNFSDRKSKISVHPDSVATQKRKLMSKQLQLKKIQKHPSKSSDWSKVNSSLSKPVASNKISVNSNHCTLSSNVIKINPPLKVMQSIKGSNSNHQGVPFVFSSRLKETNEPAASSNHTDTCVVDSFKALNTPHALSPAKGCYSCSSDLSSNVSKLISTSPNRTQLPGLRRSKNKVIISIDTSKNETSFLQPKNSKLPISSCESQNSRKDKINSKSLQALSDSMLNSSRNGKTTMPSILTKKILPMPGTATEDSNGGPALQHVRSVTGRAACSSAKRSKEKASQTSAVSAMLQEEPTEQPSASTNIANCERLFENCSSNSGSAGTNTMHYVPAVTSTLAAQCISNPIHYMANTLSSSNLGSNGSTGLRITLPPSVIHTIPVDTINFNSKEFKIPSMTMMPTVPQYVIANSSQKAITPDASLATLTHSFAIPTKNGTCIQTNINMPSLEKAFHSSQVLGIGVLPVPPPTPVSTSPYKCQSPNEVIQNPTKKLKLTENRVLIKVFTGKRLLKHTSSYSNQPKGDELGAGISIEALEEEGIDLTSLVCDPLNSNKEGPYVFHFPPNPALNRNSGIERKFSSSDSPSYERICEVLQRNAAALEHRSNEGAIKMVYDPETDNNIVIQVTGMSHSGSANFRNPMKKSKKDIKANSNNNNSSSSSALELQRTRSGRISRPPQHRVKDYKLLRRVNYDANPGNILDYHDYNPHHVESDAKNLSYGDINDNIHRKKRNGLPSLARERYTCPTCKKLYMGQQKLLRHYQQYPKHLHDALTAGLAEESCTNSLATDNNDKNSTKVTGSSTISDERGIGSNVSDNSTLASNITSRPSPKHRETTFSNVCKDSNCEKKKFPVIDVDEIPKQTSRTPEVVVSEMNYVSTVTNPIVAEVNVSPCKEMLCSADVLTPVTGKLEVSDYQKLTQNNCTQLSTMVPQIHATSIDGALQDSDCYLSVAESFLPSSTSTSVNSTKSKAHSPEISMPITTLENGSNEDFSFLKPKCLTMQLEEVQVNKLPPVTACSTLNTPGGNATFNSSNFSNPFGPANLDVLPDHAAEHEIFSSIEPISQCISSPKPSVKREQFLTDTDLMKLDPNLESFMNSSSSSDGTDSENKNDSCEMSPLKIKDNFEDNIPEISNQSFTLPGFNDFDDVMSKQELETPPLSDGINLFGTESAQLKIPVSSSSVNNLEKCSGKTSAALSPTPGTRPSEVNPEPSLPVETDCGLHTGTHLPRAGSVLCSSVSQKKMSSMGGSPSKTLRNSVRDSVSKVKSNADGSSFESPTKVSCVASNPREGSAKESSSSLKVHIKKNSNDEYFAVTQIHTDQPVSKTLIPTLTSQSSSEAKVVESVRPKTLKDDEDVTSASIYAPLVKKNQNKPRGRGRGRGRNARGNSSRKSSPVAQCNAFPTPVALNDTLNSFPVTEIASTVFPRLQREISLWEIFCLQASCSPNVLASCSNPAPAAVTKDKKLENAITLLSKLLDQCRSELKNVLHSIPVLENKIPDENSEGRAALLHVPENVALAIGMKCGKYSYKDEKQLVPPQVSKNIKSKENDMAEVAVGFIEQQSGQKPKDMFHCKASSSSLQTITNVEDKSSVNLGHCNDTPSVSQTFVTTERQSELLNSVLDIRSTLSEEASVTDFRTLPQMESPLVQVTTIANLVETGSHLTKRSNLLSAPEISKNDNSLLHSKMLCDDGRKIVKSTTVDCVTTLQNLKPIHQTILSGDGNVNINGSSFLVPEMGSKRGSAILEPPTEPKNTVQSKINSDCKSRHAHAIPCGSEKTRSPFDRPYLDVSKSDPLLGFSSAAVGGNSHPGSSSFIMSITHDPISTIHNGVNSNQMNSSPAVKSNLMSDRDEKPIPSPIEFSPLSFTECTTSYDLSSFLLQGATPPLDTNAGGKSPVRTVQDSTLPPLCNSAKFSQTIDTSLDVLGLQSQSGTASQRSSSLNDFISPSLEVSVPFSNESSISTGSSVFAFRDRHADLGKTDDGLKLPSVGGNPTYQGNSANNTTVSSNELRYNVCPNTSNYIPSSVFDTLYLQPNTLPNLLTKFAVDNQALSTPGQDSNELTKSAPPPRKSKKSKEKSRSTSSFLSKFTNANFKEVDTPSSNQPIASLIHSQSMAEKNKKVDEKKSHNHSDLIRKTAKERDASALPKAGLNSDNSAVYGPLQDSSLNNISDNGSIVAQPATSPISALLQSSFHSVLTQDAVGVTCTEQTNAPSHPFSDSPLTTITEQSVSRNLPSENQTFTESPQNSSVVNCNHQSNTRTVVSPAGFHPASSPTQSFTFPISACGGSRNGAVDGNNLCINSSLTSSFDGNSNAITSSYVASLSTFISPSAQCINVSAPTFNSMPPSSQPHYQHPSISSPKSSCCPTQPYSSSPVCSYVLTSSMPSPSNSYAFGPNVAQKTLLRNGTNGLSGNMTPPPFSQNCFTSPLVNSSVSSFPRITSPVNHDGTMVYTSSRIAAGSSMSPPLSSLLPTSHVNHHGPGPPGSPAGSPLCTNPNIGRNSCTTPLRGSTRPLLSPTTLLGLPFSSISPDIANLEPPLPCTSGSIPALSELELTSDDLPRLLSTGDSSSQSCGASKLLDTNTADLTEIIQKLQQETAGSACLETSEAQLSASIASEFRPPAPSFKGVLQSKADGDSVCVHSASLNDTLGTKASSGLPCFGDGSTSNQSPVSLVASVPPRTGMCQSNPLRDLQLSDPSLSPNCTMITSFTDVLSSNAHFSNTALSQLTSSAGACVIADPGSTLRNRTMQCQEERALLRQVTSTETIVQNMLNNVIPMNMDQQLQNNSVPRGKLVNSISHCDQLSSANENGSHIRIQNSPVHSKVHPVDQALRSVKSNTLQESNLISRSEKIICNSRASTEFPDQLSSVGHSNDPIGNGVVSNGTQVVYHSGQDLTSTDSVSTFRSLPHNSVTPSGREQHSFRENAACQQYCGFSHHTNEAPDTDFSTVTRVNCESTGRIATTTASGTIANITYEY
ncbi:hypothetical protein FHG87_008163 [Trinorchestia longiramus]|nr:hypothetical protein FHG87_008163 [Trinorchestia longiramus]